MNVEIKKRWIAALLSGDFSQGRGVLNYNDQRFCCLGVLCELAARDGVCTRSGNTAVVSYDGRCADLPGSVCDWAGLGQRGNYVAGGEIETLMFDNDGKCLSFAEIAEIIREHF